uniref:Uncharacterized protein n=1 Tax=Hanusia phi TaxID=3032 RepID=A0A7S0ENX4_9CRYP
MTAAMSEDDKTKGNEAFKKGEFDRALEHYSRALETAENHVIRSNRSACFSQLGQHEKALVDAEEAIRLAPSWPKGYSRKAAALFFMGELDQAHAAYSRALELDPKDELVRQALADVALEQVRKMRKQRLDKICKSLKSQKPQPQVYLNDHGLDDDDAALLCRSLHGNSTVQSLWLGDNIIGDAGATAIASVLRNNSALLEINLCSNKIGDEGATALSEALTVNQTLTELYLNRNCIGQKGAFALARALEVNVSLIRVGLSDNPVLQQSNEIKRAIDDQLWANRSHEIVEQDCKYTCNRLCMPKNPNDPCTPSMKAQPIDQGQKSCLVQ